MNDLIDRKQALKEINERHEKAVEWFLGTTNNDFIKAKAESALASFTECYITILKLPSAKPPPETCWGCNCPKMEEPKRGKWEKQITRHFLDSRASVGVEMKEATGRGYHIYVNLKCSNCNKVTIVSESILYKFCPHCGAEMTISEPYEEEVEIG